MQQIDFRRDATEACLFLPFSTWKCSCRALLLMRFAACLLVSSPQLSSRENDGTLRPQQPVYCALRVQEMTLGTVVGAKTAALLTLVRGCHDHPVQVQDMARADVGALMSMYKVCRMFHEASAFGMLLLILWRSSMMNSAVMMNSAANVSNAQCGLMPVLLSCQCCLLSTRRVVRRARKSSTHRGTCCGSCHHAVS